MTELGLAVVLLVGGCTNQAPVICAGAPFDPPARLTCDAAVTAAREKLTGVGVIDLRMQYGLPCPPDARCAAPSGDEATVYATLADGDTVIVIVTVDPAGMVHANDAQPLPTFLPAVPQGR